MRLLFEELDKKPLCSEDRIGRYKDWIKNATMARKNLTQEGKAPDKKSNQYDKAEELITFYTFAPLCLREDKVEIVQEMLRLVDAKTEVGRIKRLSFEEQFPPPKGYLKWLANHIDEHPVRFLRKQAIDHMKRGKTLETNTHVDFAVETDNLLILIEMKFTSDISFQTTFNPNRNQLARLIDVGISAAEKSGKKLVVLLCSPSEFFAKKSRLYYYKIKEYSDVKEIKKDIEWRKQDEIQKYIEAVAWIPLEKIIEIVYKDFNHPDREEAIDFFRERRLVP